MPADVSSRPAAAVPAAAASSPGAAQALQAAVSHRESVHRAFESQRAALMETIEKQRLTMSEATANARRSPAQTTGQAPVQCSDEAWARLSADCNAGDRLIMSLAMMGVIPGTTGTPELQAQCAIAAHRFLAALKGLIIEEIVKQAIRAEPAHPARGEAADRLRADQ